MVYVVGIVVLLFGIGIAFNVGGLAVWGSRDRWGAKDSSGQVRTQPVWVTRFVGVVAIGMGLYILISQAVT